MAKQRPTFLPFEEARAYVHTLKIKNQAEWNTYCKSGQRPDYIPSNPNITYRDDFKGMGDWLGTGYVATHCREYMPFEQARAFVRSLGLKTVDEWRTYCKSGNKPDNIPVAPHQIYKHDFQGYGDWLGTGNVHPSFRTYFPFEQARAFVHTLRLKTNKEWATYCKSGNKPDYIPAAPRQVYKGDFQGWGDWLGTGSIASYNRVYLPFEEARAIARSLGLRNVQEWRTYCTSGDKPGTIPSNPDSIYKDDFKSWGDWLGTGIVANRYRQFLSFEEARAFVHTLRLKNEEEWRTYYRSGNKPDYIPVNPSQVYASAFKGMGDWLGTGIVANRYRQFLPFEEARAFVHQLELRNKDEWADYCKSDKRPEDIPASPGQAYGSAFRGWGDWLGIVNKWSKNALLALLQDLRPRLAHLAARELYVILQQGGVLPGLQRALGNASPMQVLVDLQESNGKGIEQGLATIAESDELALGDDLIEDETIAESDGIVLTSQITTTSPHALDATALPGLPLQEQLHVVDLLIELSCGLDDTAAEYLVVNRVAALWETYITEDRAKVDELLANDGGHWYGEIKRRFLEELDGVEHLSIPVGWAFRTPLSEPAQPNAMQKRTAWAIHQKRRVGNWSGVGSGKTLAAILASRVIDAHLTLIITNNATVGGWKAQIKNAYPDSLIAEQQDGHFTINHSRHTYIVLNYEKFQGPNRHTLVRQLLDLGLDFIVFDEVQFVKQRSQADVDASYRRECLAALVCEAEARNPALCVLGMSATPVINNLIEAKKLLEIVTGLQFPELATAPTVNNALAMHRELMLYGFRYRPRYEQEMHQQYVPVVCNDLLAPLQEAKGSVLRVEQTLLEAKLDAIKLYLRKGVLVYAHYVDEIIALTRAYIEALGFSVGLYTGADKSGYVPFCQGKVDILLGTSPVGTGLDGLQKVCNRVVMLILPWTSAEYEQIVGRVRRQGSAFSDVDIIIPQVMLDYQGDTWSWDLARMDCITFKRTLSDCVLDGTIPQCVHISPKALLEQSREALERWIARIGDEGLLTIERERLVVPLPADVRTSTMRKFGDFSMLNHRWNTSNSSTTHDRLQADASEWYLYHTLYREARECWPELPVTRIAARIAARPDWRVGDFGCGECLLQEVLPGVQVIGIDHVACNETVTACDMAHTPLADSELDAAVFSLSLMGANWRDYLVEAARTLKPYGHLFIAEAATRWQGKQDDLIDALQTAGFALLGNMEQRYDFLYLTTIKLPMGSIV